MKLTKPLAIIITSLFLTQATFAANETHFDLNAQNFSEALKDGEMISARYNLPKSYVTTNLKHDSTYHTLNDNGFFKVEVKQALTNWGVSLDMGYKFDNPDNSRSIILTADNGTALTIGLSEQYGFNGGVYFEGQDVYDTGADERLSITINKDNTDTDTVTLNINGREVASVSKPGFSKLKFVEAQLIQEANQNDAMHSLIIAGE